MVQPMFSVRPESFNTIDMVTTFRFSFILVDCDMVATSRKERVCMPLISILQTPRLRVLCNQQFQLLCASAGYGEGQHVTITLVHAENHVFSDCAPAEFAGMFAAAHCFVHLDLAGQRCQFFYRMKISDFPENSIPSLNRFLIKRNLKPQPIGGNTGKSTQ